MISRSVLALAFCIAITATSTLDAQPARTRADTAWRQGGVCYEIFVRSFFDGDGDGIGDFAGLTRKLDYVNEVLGTEQRRIAFANAQTLRTFSSILHGEQGALNLSASLCHVLYDQGAQEYAANQTREEARHVTAFAKYIKARWGRPRPCGTVLKQLLVDIIEAPEVYKKIIGMQMLVEGLAMGAFATGYQFNRDPLAKKLFQLVMTDEAFHHRFGRIWAQKTMPKLTEEEHNKVEDWASQVFQMLPFNLVNPEQKRIIYQQFRREWGW
jgi:hypothetical protein